MLNNKKPLKRALILDDDDDDEEEDRFYRLNVLLPNRTSVTFTVTNPDPVMPMKKFLNLVKEEYEKSRKNCVFSGKKRKQIDWNLAAESDLEFNGEKTRGFVRFEKFKTDLCNIIRLDDGSGEASIMYENMWDLTPDPELLKELPENYSFETALADLIDNSLQAVWSCSPGDRRLISVDVLEDRISIFDSGPGMDSNSIDKWGKIGASTHRSHKSDAIGGKPPYLMPFFGMFGYGGFYASIHLGRRTMLSSKTKQSKNVLCLQLSQEALIDSRSIPQKNWKTSGGMRDPSEEEIKLSPHGSFTKVEIFEPICKIPELYHLQCRLKDIYFPYIQNDEISKSGRTVRPVEFQVSGEDLAEIEGGEVATTNLNSKGEDFWFQIRFTACREKKEGTVQKANARLRFAYIPIIRGKEGVDIITERLRDQGYKVSDFQSFRRVSVRRLGRLLPEVPWASIPFMERGARATTLQKCCQRVKCFVDLDAGFSPSPSKTDLATQNLFSVALKNFGSKSKEKDNNDVTIVIHREGKTLNFGQVEQSYQEWVLEKHKSYDEEHASGEDEAIIVFDSLDNKSLCISPDCEAVRVHKVMKRKGMSWERGKNIKILRGACGGVHNNDVYATIDYFIIENFDDETGGDARIICRQFNVSEDDGCVLSILNGVSKLELRSSSSFPIGIIDSGKCLLLDENEWNRKLERQKEKDPSRIDLLDESDCRELNLTGESRIGDSVCAGQTPPQQIVAVVRPANFTSSKLSKKLDQKHIVKMNEEMLMEVELQDKNMKERDKNAKPLYSDRSFPTSRRGFHGLYIFPLESKFPNLFEKAGTYKLRFSIGNLVFNQKVVVKPSSKVGSWKLAGSLDSMQQCSVRVGSSFPSCSIACFDEYENRIPFASVPRLEVKLKASPTFEVTIAQFEANLIRRGILKVKNMLVETTELDKIRPHYKATLEIRSRDEPFSVSVACNVNPGPLKCVVEKNRHALEKLLPGSTVENYILEMFDGYGNHVAEGTDVLLCIDGYGFQDSMGLNRKVDTHGCIDLSGILRVTAGYGQTVSLSVMYDDEEIFKKESLVLERELRLLKELPEHCTAGSNLTNLIFRVTDSDGIMDTSIHHDEKSGCFHTLSIESDSRCVERGIRYDFVHGSCKVPSLPLPETEGVFSFKVFHSRYPELHMSLKIPLTSAQTSERDENWCSTSYSRMSLTPQSRKASTTHPRMAPTQQTPSSQCRGLSIEASPTPLSSQTGLMDIEQYNEVPSLPFKATPAATQQTPSSGFRVLSIKAAPSPLSSQTGLMDIEQFTEVLKEKLSAYETSILEVEERLKCLEAEHEQADQEFRTLQGSLKPLGVMSPECLSTKESMMKYIEEKRPETAASVFCCLYRKAPHPQSLFLAKKGVFGLVALLGSVATTALSRVLSDYLGEDTMLTLVCKSSRFGPSSAEYLKLQSEAVKLGRSITKRFHVLCLDATRPWMDGVVENDPQEKLAMDEPKLPDGDPIPGFVGYAVNMIELAPEDLKIKTYAGHGLRETLFYGLFGNLQVYETQTHVEKALPYIKGCIGAVSLDGFIAKENEFIYSGCSKPEIHFPISIYGNGEAKLRKLEEARERARIAAEKIVEERSSLRKLEKKLKKMSEKYDSINANTYLKRAIAFGDSHP